MEFRRIQSAGRPAFDRAFRLYQISFPIHEQRTREKQEAVLSHPDYHYETIWEKGEFAGILLYWETAEFFYVEHFAIAPELRGQGCGSRALERLASRGKSIVLEIDPPVDETGRRRQHFYETVGFHANPWPHIHPPYRPGFAGHELVVMTSPGGWGEEEYERFSSYLRKTVMEDCADAG